MTVSIELQMEQMGQRAKKAARVLSAAAPAAKTQALRALAALLIERQPDILKANALDVDAAKAANMDAPRLDRLTLTPRIMADMADACLHVAEMADEVGVIEQQWQLSLIHIYSLQRLSPLLNPSSFFPCVIWDCRFYLATCCKRMPGNTYKDGRNIKRFL